MHNLKNPLKHEIKALLSVVFTLFLTFILSSYQDGPAHHAGIVGTGATGAYYGCSSGGCHGSTTANNVVIELDSAGIPVQSYYPGIVYTVKISGTNGTSATNLSHFGFQVTSVLVSGSGTGAAAQAGTWSSSLPASTHATAEGALKVVEHSAPLAANSGTGGAGTYYADSISWTAPDSGTGTIILAGALNAVNYDGSNGGDYSQLAPADTIKEAAVRNTNGINDLSAMLGGFSAYPTLMGDNVTIAFDVKQASAVGLSLVSIHGETVRQFMSQEALGQGNFKRSFAVSGLSTGVYLVRLEIGNESVVTKVVKE